MHNVIYGNDFGPYTAVVFEGGLSHSSPLSNDHDLVHWRRQGLRKIGYPDDWRFTQENLLRRSRWEVYRENTPPTLAGRTS